MAPRREERLVRMSIVVGLLGLVWLGLVHCADSGPRSRRSFSELSRRIQGQSAAQILELLGEPDSRRPVLDGDERWLWWNYTFLDGRDVPPELRGKVVHLDIVVVNPERGGSKRPPYSEWRIDDALGIRYRLPGAEP